MDCLELKARALAYIYAELNAAERRAAEEHLAACAACRLEVKGMADMADLVGKVEQVAPSSEFQKRFAALVAAGPGRGGSAGGGGGSGHTGRWLRLGAAVAAGLGVFVYLRSGWAPLPPGPAPALPPHELVVAPELRWRDGTDSLIASLKTSLAAKEQPAATEAGADDSATELTVSQEADAIDRQASLLNWKLDPSPRTSVDRDLETLRSNLDSIGADLGEGG